MTTLPNTIIYPEAFNASPAAGFDGVLDWQWMIDIEKRLFPTSKITPTDGDAIMERNEHLVIYETKNIGTNVGFGQRRALRTISKHGQRAVILWGIKRKGIWSRWAHCYNGGEWGPVRECSNLMVYCFHETWRVCAEENDMRIPHLREMYTRLMKERAASTKEV